jgi:acetyl esterase/lipase
MSSEGPTENVRDEIRPRARRALIDRSRLTRWGEGRPGVTDAYPPEQPLQGPGGKEYRHITVQWRVQGNGPLAYWIFEPADPVPTTAPLIIFLHGWGGNSPANFGAWIDHLVKRGNLIVFPLYQDSLRTPPDTMLTNAIMAVKGAILRQEQEGMIRLDLQRVAIVGHSLGATLAAQMAAVAKREKLPVPKAIMPIAPGRGEHQSRQLPWIDLRAIPLTVLVLVVVGEDDQNAGDIGGKVIFTSISQVPLTNKNFLVMRSDYHGTPPLVANHRSPGAANPAYWTPGVFKHEQPAAQRRFPRDLPPVDAMDYYGYWKFFDGLTDAAFSGRNRIYALGDTPQQRFMGTWSDGTPVREPRVITDPRMFW